MTDDDVAKLIPSVMKKEIVQKKYLNQRQQEAIDAHKKFLEKHAVSLDTVASAVDDNSADQEAIKDRLLAEELMNKQKFANMKEVAKYQFFGKPWQTVGALTAVGCLTFGISGMGKQGPRTQNLLMRGRIGGQAFAVGAIMYYLAFYEEKGDYRGMTKDGYFRPDWYGWRPFGE